MRHVYCHLYIVECDQVYKERVLTITLNCAHLAAKMSVKKFIEVSTAQVYDSSKVRSCEHHVSIGGCVHLVEC